jgi:hypothetical protein
MLQTMPYHYQRMAKFVRIQSLEMVRVHQGMPIFDDRQAW